MAKAGRYTYRQSAQRTVQHLVSQITREMNIILRSSSEEGGRLLYEAFLL